MRVIAGKYKGRVLEEVASKAVRPTMDRIKETIFNILQMRLPGSRVLDLFCGTGSLGIEALSRGAALCVFNDVFAQSVHITKNNLARLNEMQTVLNLPFEAAILALQRQKAIFDIVFIDAPYTSQNGCDALKMLLTSEVLAPDAIIAFETADKTFAQKMPAGAVLFKEKQFSNKAYYLIQKQTN